MEVSNGRYKILIPEEFLKIVINKNGNIINNQIVLHAKAKSNSNNGNNERSIYNDYARESPIRKKEIRPLNLNIGNNGISSFMHGLPNSNNNVRTSRQSRQLGKSLFLGNSN